MERREEERAGVGREAYFFFVLVLRRCKKLPPCRMQPLPAGSKMDLPLAKAEPINNSGGTTEKTCLRMGKNGCTTTASREE